MSVTANRIELKLKLQGVDCPIISCAVSNNILGGAQIEVLYTAALRKIEPSTRVEVYFRTDGAKGPFFVLFLGYISAVTYTDDADSKRATLNCEMDYALTRRFQIYQWSPEVLVESKQRTFSGAPTVLETLGTGVPALYAQSLSEYFFAGRTSIATKTAPRNGVGRAAIGLLERVFGVTAAAADVSAASPLASQPGAATAAETSVPAANAYAAVMGAQSNILEQIAGIAVDIKQDVLLEKVASSQLLEASVKQIPPLASVGELIDVIASHLFHVVYTVPTAGIRDLGAFNRKKAWAARVDAAIPPTWRRDDLALVTKTLILNSYQDGPIRILANEAQATLELEADQGGADAITYARVTRWYDTLMAYTPSTRQVAQKQKQIVTTIVVPNLYFALPPACNVVMPNMISSLTYTVPHLERVTRGLMFAMPVPASGAQLQTNTDWKLHYYSPTGAVSPSGEFVLQDHEAETGIRLFISDITAVASYLETLLNNESDAMQRLADYRFMEERYASTTLQVSGPFNPYVCPGLPCIVEDDGKHGGRPAERYQGFIQGVQHVISAGAAITTYSLSHVITASEDAPELLRKGTKSAENYHALKSLHDLLLPTWLTAQHYDVDHIGDTYQELLVCGAADHENLRAGARPLATEADVAQMTSTLIPACAAQSTCPTGSTSRTPPATPVNAVAAGKLSSRRAAAEAYATSCKERRGFGDAK
jgi:hypothetical protein